jgi:hypothetical protein
MTKMSRKNTKPPKRTPAAGDTATNSWPGLEIQKRRLAKRGLMAYDEFVTDIDPNAGKITAGGGDGQ